MILVSAEVEKVLMKSFQGLTCLLEHAGYRSNEYDGVPS